MSNNTRAPTKNEIKSYIEAGKTNEEISAICGISIRTVQRHRKALKTTSNSDTKNDSDNDRRQAINEARIRVVSGETLKSASEKVGIPISTLGEYSVKENWIEKQKAFNQHLFNKLLKEKGEQHIERRSEAIEFLNYIQRKTMKNLGENDLSKDDVIVLERATNIVLKTMKGQAELMGMIDIKLSGKLENEPKEENENSKVETAINRLEEIIRRDFE